MTDGGHHQAAQRFRESNGTAKLQQRLEKAVRGLSLAEVPLNSSFLRKRKMSRGVLVLDGSLASLEPHLKKKNFHVINLPEGAMDAERKELVLSQRTLITKTPQGFEDDVPVLEYSLIDASDVTLDHAILADFISHAWTRFRLKSEGWFILRLRSDGDHKIQFPE